MSENLPEFYLKLNKDFDDYFHKGKWNFDVKLNPYGTEFQQSVWNELQKIPFGKTISYLDLARKLGDEKVIRAAGSANGKNPIAILIPCHRVIGKDGSLTGYAGGIYRKKYLLELEKGIKSIELF
jgi:methylated-DNA-[protein]-cysteine S-methyltransferase